MNEHEVYPNAPVVLVALEIRHPAADPLTRPDRRAIKNLLGGDRFIMRTSQMLNVQIAGQVAQQVGNGEEVARFLDRQSTTVVTLHTEGMTVETTRYQGWEAFRALARTVFDARQEVAPVDGYERVGLRFFSEIRDPESNWSEWVDGSLLGPHSKRPIDLDLAQWQGVTVYGSQPGRALVLRHGPRDGYVVDPNGELKQPNRGASGPFFLLDIDSFWTRSDELPMFKPADVEDFCNELHTPIRTLFEGLITDQLREAMRHARD